MAVADEQLQPVLPASLPASLLVLCHACCDFDPEMRPSFKTVVDELSAAIDEIKAAVRDLNLLILTDLDPRFGLRRPISAV
jgi:hypothetical protein